MSHDLFPVCLFNCKENKNAAMAIRSAHCFGAAGVHFFGSHTRGFNNIGPGDTAKAYRQIPVTATVGSDIPEMKGGVLIGVEFTDDSDDLVGFHHAKVASYIFGPENGSLPPDIVEQCDRIVKIPTRYCLNLSMAVSIVLYDRVAKRARGGGRAFP